MQDVRIHDHTYSRITTVPKIYGDGFSTSASIGSTDSSSISACIGPTDSSSTLASIGPIDSAYTSAYSESIGGSDIPICEEIVVSFNKVQNMYS